MRSFRLHYAAVITATLLSSSVARADMYGSYSSSTNYTITHSHMPDLDQRRKAKSGTPGLPGDGGMYCVPTATMNMIMYISNHGFPSVNPGPHNWQLQGNYNTATNLLSTMGGLMGTTAGGGTGGNGWYSGAWVWMLPHWKFQVNKYYASGFYSPTFQAIAMKAMGGSLVALCYGRYTVTNVNGNIITVSNRTGGHAVTFSKASRSGSSMTLKVRDPADESANLYAQSQFGNNVYSMKDVVVVGPGWVRTMSAINWPSSDGIIRLIDGIVTIKPISGYSFQNGRSPTINIHRPFELAGTDLPQVDFVPTPGNAPILDMAQLPGSDEIVAFLQGTRIDTLELLNPLTGQSRTLFEALTGRKVVVGRQREIFALAGRTLYRVDPDDVNEPVQDAVVPPIYPVEGLGFDDAADRVLLLSVSDRRLARYSRAFVLQSNWAIPTSVPMAGDGSVDVNPEDGRAWFCSDGSNSLFEIYQSAIGPIVAIEHALPGVRNPKQLQFGDDGRLLVKCDAGLLAFQQDANSIWLRITSEFDGIDVGEGFRIDRSRSNYDPNTMDGPAFQNLPPEQVVRGRFETDNPGDMNCDGLTNFNDINPFVLALSNPAGYALQYETCNPLNGDINLDGAMNFADINPFVTLLSGQ